MNTNQAHILASIRNAEGFLDQHADLFATRIKPAFRTRLSTALTTLSATIAEQEGLTRKAKGSAKDRAALRTVLLHEHMAPISRVASIELTNTPAFAQFTMPKGRTCHEGPALATQGGPRDHPRHGCHRAARDQGRRDTAGHLEEHQPGAEVALDAGGHHDAGTGRDTDGSGAARVTSHRCGAPRRRGMNTRDEGRAVTAQ